jgi:alkanesulfonate monooxygenase
MPNISDLSIMLFPWGAEKTSVNEIVEIAKLAEDLGFYSATMPTHMTMPPGWLFETFTNHDVLDALVVVPLIAGATSQIKIGFNSTLPPLLPPYEWAKYLSTLDVISEGRLIAGMAMGWWDEDFTSVGVDQKARGKLFDEQLEVITRLWQEDRVTFDGAHYQLTNIPLEPKPVQKPYPPIWIGGGLKSIWRAARYGECILAFWLNEDEVRNQWIPKLKEEGTKYGTDPKLASFTFAYVADNQRELEAYGPKLKTAVAFNEPDVDPRQVTISGSPDACAERIRALHAAGIWHFVVEFQLHGLESPRFAMKQMEKFAKEVAPLL